MQTARCISCGEEKSVEDFSPKRHQCKQCLNKIRTDWNKINPEKHRKYSRESYQKYKKEINKRKREKYQKDHIYREKMKTWSHRWLEKQPKEIIISRNKQKYQNYRENYIKKCRNNPIFVDKPQLWHIAHVKNRALFGKNRRKTPIEFNVTLDDLCKVWTGKCAVSGIPLSLVRVKEMSPWQTASLDRKDSDKGYTIDNIHWVHIFYNLTKGKRLDKDFLKYWENLVAPFVNQTFII